jgi:hypothetical protein
MKGFFPILSRALRPTRWSNMPSTTANADNHRIPRDLSRYTALNSFENIRFVVITLTFQQRDPIVLHSVRFPSAACGQNSAAKMVVRFDNVPDEGCGIRRVHIVSGVSPRRAASYGIGAFRVASRHQHNRCEIGAALPGDEGGRSLPR